MRLVEVADRDDLAARQREKDLGVIRALPAPADAFESPVGEDADAKAEGGPGALPLRACIDAGPPGWAALQRGRTQ